MPEPFNHPSRDHLPPADSPATKRYSESLLRHTHEFRVSYHHTDGQRRVHHSNYPNYFEDARVEMLRVGGLEYKAIEDSGRLLVVTEMNVQYFAAAEFDDWLRVEVEVVEIRKVRLRHHYRVLRDETLIATGQSTIACVGPNGKPKRLPQPFLDFAEQVWPKQPAPAK